MGSGQEKEMQIKKERKNSVLGNLKKLEMKLTFKKNSV